MTSVSLQAAFILHHRPFRDTSVIADLLTPDYGRISVVAHGVRSAKSRRRVLLQPFRPVLASWSGRSNLRSLGAIEESGMPVPLAGSTLACAYYTTELALRLIPENIPNQIAFALYARTLAELSETTSLEATLRIFEIELLEVLGVLPDFSRCNDTAVSIDASQPYQFDPAAGRASAGSEPVANCVPVSGKTLLAMSQRVFDDSLVLAESKRLMRRIVQQQLGGRELKSRDVFSQLNPGHRPATDSNA